MFGNEIARVHAHDNGYTVETRTKPVKPQKGKVADPYVDGPAPPNLDWESHVATNKQQILDRVAAAHEAHTTGKMKQQYQKLTTGKK